MQPLLFYKNVLFYFSEYFKKGSGLVGTLSPSIIKMIYIYEIKELLRGVIQFP